MNKISKKIVSLITMAAFVLTLVPAAAFGATSADSSFTVKAVDYNTAEVSFTLDQDDLGYNTVIWATDSKGAPVSDVTYESKTAVTSWDDWGGNAGVLGGADATNSTLTADTTYTVEMTFGTPGEYDIHVGANKVDFTGALDKLDPVKVQGSNAVTASFTRDNVADPDYSGYGVVENGAVVEKAEDIDVDEVLDTTFVVNYAHKQGTTAPLTDVSGAKVTVWAQEDGKNVPTTFATFDNVQGSKTFTVGSDEDKLVYNGKPVVKVSFDKPGDYTLYAKVETPTADGKTVTEPLQYATKVHVNDKVYTIDRLEVEATTSNKVTPVEIEFDSNNMGKLDLTELDPNFDYDGIDDVILNGVAYDEDNNKVQGKEIVATTNKDSVIEFDGNKETKTTTNFGEFTISFDMQDKSNGTVYLTNEEDGIEYSIQVIAAKTSATNIDRTKTGGYVLAGNDKTYGDATYKDKTSVNFTDAVQFEVTDQKNEPVTGNDAIKGYKLELRAKSNDDSKLKSDDLNLVWDADNGVYTLAYVGGNAYAEDLVPGKYEVRVALPSGDNATVTFNVAKFGKVQDTVLDIHAHDADMWNPANPNAYTINVDDQITLGQFVTVNAVYVDENGIKVDAPDVNYGFNGDAVRDIDVENGTFVTPADSAVNDSLIGTEIEVIAYNTANKQLVTKTLTVVKSYTDKTLEFGSEQGPIAKDNKVPVSVVNEDGKVQQVKGTITAWVADQSNEDAKVSVDTTNATVNSGKGSITVYSDEETTADIVVIVKAGTEVYPATLHYTFGAEDPLANRTVVMTIDSTEYVVNNNVFTGDAAPYIDDAWRTMVPIRALMEAFDSEVIWNQDDETVTVNFDGDTQIVMTVGETGYTIDGVDGEMDTVPVNTGDRVYVPIRFVAEGIGFHVTPLYNADGLTASVVFQK